MFSSSSAGPGFVISHIASCDFSQLESIDNATLLEIAGKSASGRLQRFLEQEMGIAHRYRCPPQKNALDLARSAVDNLIALNPEIPRRAQFVIACGISSPMPVTTTSALLAGEFGFLNPSCWDLKSGCSTGVLAFIQARQWLNEGMAGVIICSETLSKFANPDILQMAASVGDGAVALWVEPSDEWEVKSLVHGTDPALATSMLVRGTFPVDIDDYRAEDYFFSFENKPDGIAAIARYWVQSLRDLLQGAGITPEQVKHYIAHQVDAAKNAAIAKTCGIPDESVARNFSRFGNMGCPTVFLNYQQWIQRKEHCFNPGDHLIFHAVGGGVSWAGICLVRK